MKKFFAFLSLIFTFEIFPSDGPIASIKNPIETEFGTYYPFPVSIVPSVEPYQILSDLSNISNKDKFNLTEEQKNLLTENGFFITPSSGISYGTGYNEMYDIYIEAEEKALPVFITSDIMLHSYHRIYDWILKGIEEERFFNTLNELDIKIYEEAIEYDLNLNNDSTFILASYFLVPLKILNPEFAVPSKYENIVLQEIELIEEHSGIYTSPIFNYEIDYSQFKPRGHYTRSENLKKYFKAMMWHGKVAFCLKDWLGNPSKNLTASALLLTKIFYNNNFYNLWNSIYLPTTFFVGKADDPLLFDYLRIAKEVYGENFLSLEPNEILKDEKILQFIEKADLELPEPKIRDIVGKGLRFMGQRFIPDSYIFTELTHPKVDKRFLPMGLDVMAVLGSDLSFEILKENGEINYKNYVEQLNFLKNLFKNYSEEKWVENLYWNWLYTLMPLLYQKGYGFPTFMQNIAWTKKDLVTSLGSWTELRHDTILYAKQSNSGYGDTENYFCLLSYVEPNPDLFGRLASLALYTINGLNNLKILNEIQNKKLSELYFILINLKNISEKELINEILTEEEWEFLANFGSSIKDLLSEPSEEGANYLEDEPIPIIADVHTDPNLGNCLEEGIGYPMRIFVVVPQRGKLYLTVGAVFSYYEFIEPIENRLSDEEWREILKSQNPPLLPQWTDEIRDSSSLYNPSPNMAYLTKIFEKVKISWEVKEEKLYLWVSILPPDLDFMVFFNETLIEPLSVSEKNKGSEIIIQIPSKEKTKVVCWLYGYNGLFEEWIEFYINSKDHKRPF